MANAGHKDNLPVSTRHRRGHRRALLRQGACQDAVGKTVFVENRPGAFGNIATEAIARSKPDGYTVGIMASSAIAAAPALYKTVPFDPVNDFDQVATLMRVPWFLIVAADSPYKTVADLTDYLKKQGDKASYASVANSGLISSELYKLKFGLPTVEVKYKDAFLMLERSLRWQHSVRAP